VVAHDRDAALSFTKSVGDTVSRAFNDPVAATARETTSPSPRTSVVVKFALLRMMCSQNASLIRSLPGDAVLGEETASNAASSAARS
jgi:hypothetical protein